MRAGKTEPMRPADAQADGTGEGRRCRCPRKARSRRTEARGRQTCRRRKADEGDQPSGEREARGRQARRGQSDGEGPGKGPATREELEDRQLDIAAEAREIEKVLGRLNGVTDLAKERMAAAAKVAEEGGRGPRRAARWKTPQARPEPPASSSASWPSKSSGLLAEEQADRIAAAQQMAAELARQQEDFADRLATVREQRRRHRRHAAREEARTNGPAQSPKPRRKPEGQDAGPRRQGRKDRRKGQDAGRRARRARPRPTTPEEQDAAKKVEELIKAWASAT